MLLYSVFYFSLNTSAQCVERNQPMSSEMCEYECPLYPFKSVSQATSHYWFYKLCPQVAHDIRVH